MTSTNNDAVDWLPNDLGGVSTGKFERVDHPMQPWEKHCHALADVLDFHKIVSTEEKRRGVEALGEATINKLSYYERWAVCFANLLFAKGVFSPEELARKMAEVEQRVHGLESLTGLLVPSRRGGDIGMSVWNEMRSLNER